MSKQDTLGSKYPIILRNGIANYAEFPITGLISLFQDPYQNFFKQDNEGNYYYKSNKVIDKKMFGLTSSGNSLGFTTNLTSENFYIERIFREKVLEFLTNGEKKLYRSPSEGNKIIILTNINLTPKEQLGRMIYSFSATAYEVGEYSINSLLMNNIFTKEEKIEYFNTPYGKVQKLEGGLYKVERNIIANIVLNTYNSSSYKLNKLIIPNDHGFEGVYYLSDLFITNGVLTPTWSNSHININNNSFIDFDNKEWTVSNWLASGGEGTITIKSGTIAKICKNIEYPEITSYVVEAEQKPDEEGGGPSGNYIITGALGTEITFEWVDSNE